MKLKVYNVEKYINITNPNTLVECYSSVAIIKCKKGIVILGNQCIGEHTVEGMEYKVELFLIDKKMMCLNLNECKKIKLSLQDIVDNCDYEEKLFEDFVINKNKARIISNMVEAKSMIRKLNKI